LAAYSIIRDPRQFWLILCCLHYCAADQEKKKYFKIQPGHLAPTGSQYTREAIRERDEVSRVIILALSLIALPRMFADRDEAISHADA
jgi:hypothetical protein